MRRLLKLGTVYLALTAVLLPRFFVSAAEEEVAPTDRLLPPEVSVYFSIPSVEDLKAKWAGTAMGAIAADSAFEPFKEEINKVLTKASDEIEKNLGVAVKDLLSMPSGEFAIAVLTPPGKKVSAAMFLDFDDNLETVNTLLEKADKALEEQGATSDDEDVDGTTVSVWKFKTDDEQTPNTLVYFVKGTMLVATSDLDTAKAVLDRWDGKHADVFADNENYNLILKKCSTDDEDGLLTWYVDPMGLVQAALTQVAAANPQAALAMGFLEPLGVRGIKAMGGSMDLATDQFDGVSKTFLLIEQPTKGLLNVFQFPAIEQKPPRWVTTNTSAWMSVNWDIAAAYSAIETMVDMFKGPGQFAAMIDQIAQQEGGPKVHLKKDVVDVVSGRIQVVVEPGKKKADDKADERVVVALELKDAKKFQSTLAKMTKLPGFPGQSREFKGSTIYEFEVPDFNGGLETKMAGLAIGQNQLMFSNDITAVESLLRGDTDGESLADSTDYKKIAEHLPAKTSVVSYSRSDSQLQTAWDTARNGQLGLFFPEVDFSKLPDFDSVKKYLQPSGSYSVPDKKGVLFVSFSNKRDKK